MTGSRLQRVFWFALIVKLIVAAVLPLTNDEAYYWVWSKNLQLSYYDHPPAAAWLMWLGHFTDWFPSSVRWPALLLGHGALFLWLILLKPFLNEEQRLYWLLLALLSPLMGGSNLLVTPDLPLMFFFGLSTYLFLRWREHGEWLLALLLGLSIGLGLSSKYMMILFPLMLLPALYLEPSLRARAVKHLPAVLLGVAVGSLPVWLWNVMNDFVSFKFQMSHGLGHKVWKPSWTIHYVLGQVALVFPVILYWAIRQKRRLPALFSIMAWLPLLFFLCTTARGYVEANWPIMAYPAFFALAAVALPASRMGLRITLSIWGLFLAALFIVVLLNPTWVSKAKFREFHQFDGLAVRAKDLQPLYARSYQMAAKLHYLLQRPVYKLRGMNRRDFYDDLAASSPTEKSFYLVVEKGDRLPEAFVQSQYKAEEIINYDERYEIWRVQAP